MSGPLDQLELRGVGVSLGEHPILRDVNFSIATGEVVGLLGRNGAGKTTLLRAISAALPLLRGEIRLVGKLVGSISRRELARQVAVVPQDLHVPFPFSVAELVLMGRAPHQKLLGFETAQDVEHARSALERLGIDHLADRSCNELSGGERQLVLLARALVQKPSLLLLDEPTAFLDLHHRTMVLRLVRELADDQGCAVLVVSHDVTLAARACDRLLLLHYGAIDRDGPPVDVVDTESLQRVFGLDAEVVGGPDGAPLVVPKIR
ncbi:MAG: ABC transporter ATP-binding protein [Myxococcota bacterium]|nr:ABC transporter ATP-binding protein [Myxococcota bacterium]